jgi:hypothetical protein
VNTQVAVGVVELEEKFRFGEGRIASGLTGRSRGGGAAQQESDHQKGEYGEVTRASRHLEPPVRDPKSSLVALQ